MSKPRLERKPRRCMFTEQQLTEIAELLKSRFFTGVEIETYCYEHFKYRCPIARILDYLDNRGYLCAQSEFKTPWGIKNIYKIYTIDEYRKIEEEHIENAKRRLLETVSC